MTKDEEPGRSGKIVGMPFREDAPYAPSKVQEVKPGKPITTGRLGSFLWSALGVVVVLGVMALIVGGVVKGLSAMFGWGL